MKNNWDGSYLYIASDKFLKMQEELKSLKKDVQRYFELTNEYLENDEWKELHEKLSKVRSEEE